MWAAACGSRRPSSACNAWAPCRSRRSSHRRPDLRVAARELQVVEQGAQIEARAADHDRRNPAAREVAQRGASPSLVLGDVGILGHVESVQEVMAYARPVGRGGLGGADVHPAIELEGVGVDDLGPEPLGQLEGDLALARGGRAHDGDDRRPGLRHWTDQRRTGTVGMPRAHACAVPRPRPPDEAGIPHCWRLSGLPGLAGSRAFGS